eukprot:2972324-Prymnesium_polylepis.2
MCRGGARAPQRRRLRVHDRGEARTDTVCGVVLQHTMFGVSACGVITLLALDRVSALIARATRRGRPARIRNGQRRQCPARG